MDNARPSPRNWPFIAAMVLVLLVATGLRLYRLPDLPLGLHYDEAANGILAGEIAGGVKTPVFIPSYTGKEVLFFYWAALWMKLLGMTPLALRLSAALVGVATVAATVWVVYELLHHHRDRLWIALLTAGLVATSFWHVILSRYGFRAITQPLLQALTVAALWRGLRLSSPESEGKRPNSLPWLVLAGLFCGLTAYTYLAARAFPIPLAVVLLTVLVTDRSHLRCREANTGKLPAPVPEATGRSKNASKERLRQSPPSRPRARSDKRGCPSWFRLAQFSVFVAVAALVLAPLAYYWLTHPGSFSNRMQQVAASSWRDVWVGLRACLRAFFLRGDPDIRFNLPHRPLFSPVVAFFFLLGIVIAVGKIIRAAIPCFPKKELATSLPGDALPDTISFPFIVSYIFILVHTLVMLLPSALATDGIIPNNLRLVGLLPFVYIFPALGLWTVVSGLRHWVSKIPFPASDALASYILPLGAFFLLLVPLTFSSADAYFQDWAPSAPLYYTADGDLADIAAYLNASDLTGTTPYVASIHYRHPTMAFLARDYGAIRWLTGGQTVVSPSQADALLLFPRSASKDLDWVQSMLPADALIAAPEGPDGAPAFHVYRVDGPLGSPTRPLTANLGQSAQLLGYDVVNQPRSGESAEVAIWWRVLNQPAQGDYGPIARLVDPWGFAWGEKQPFHYPAEQWTPGEVIVDHLTIPVAPGAPPGDYDVCFGFYSPGVDARLPVLDEGGAYAGTAVELPIHLSRAASLPNVATLGIRDRLEARINGLTLLGANLDTTRIRPGERLYLTLFWRAESTPLPDYNVRLNLDDHTLYEDAPVHGTYPTSEWRAGEIVADRYDPRLPLNMPPGDYPLRLHIGDLSTSLGRVTVQATDRAFEVPPISHPLTANLGTQVELLGYDLSSEPAVPGKTLTLTLYWRALTEMEEDYTVFTHLLAPDGSMAGQRDNQPVGGTYATSLWLPGEVITDSYEIPIRADAAAGEGRLEVGMYIAETGARLPVAGNPDNAVVLQTIPIVSP